MQFSFVAVLLTAVISVTLLSSESGFVSAAIAAHRVVSIPGGYPPLRSKTYSGILHDVLSDGNTRSFFYILFEAETVDPMKAPFIAIQEGGPGCSTTYDAFAMTGPNLIRSGGFDNSRHGAFARNPFAWNREANVMYFDAPPGVGFSRDWKPNGTLWNDTLTANANYAFIKKFFSLYPEYITTNPTQQPLYLSSISYGGHYTPQLASRILHGDDSTVRNAMNGFIIGSPCLGTDTNDFDWCFTAGADADPNLPPFLRGHGFLPVDKKVNATPGLLELMNPPFDGNVPGIDTMWLAGRSCNLGAEQDPKKGRSRSRLRPLRRRTDVGVFSRTMRATRSGRSVEELRIAMAERQEEQLQAALEQQQQEQHQPEGRLADTQDVQRLWKLPFAPYEPCTSEFLTFFFNDPAVNSALHAEGRDWQDCRYPDTNLTYPVPPTVRGVKDELTDFMNNTNWKMVVFSGSADSDVNTWQTQAVLASFGRPILTPWTPYYARDPYGSGNTTQIAGFYVHYGVASSTGAFSYATVTGAGHLAAEQRPWQTAALFDSFLLTGKAGMAPRLGKFAPGQEMFNVYDVDLDAASKFSGSSFAAGFGAGFGVMFVVAIVAFFVGRRRTTQGGGYTVASVSEHEAGWVDDNKQQQPSTKASAAGKAARSSLAPAEEGAHYGALTGPGPNKNGEMTTTAAATTPIKPYKHRYLPFCNFPCETDCPDLSKYDYAACTETQTGGGCNLPGCKGWSQGEFPIILLESENEKDAAPFRNVAYTTHVFRNGQKARIINGGVPQAGNLTLHVDKLNSGIDDHVPQRNYAGNIVFDFERYTCVWDQDTSFGSNWHSILYQNYSIELVEKAHPTWNVIQIIEEAKKQFESSCTNWFVTSLKTIRAARPLARVGFYGLPQGHWAECITGSDNVTRCGYNNPILGPMYRKENDGVAAIWAASNAIFPSVYLQPQGLLPDAVWHLFSALYVNDTTQEAIRLAEIYGSPDTVVLPFSWMDYHNGTTHVTPQDWKAILKYTYSPPRSTGMVQWGASKESAGPFMRDIGGPLSLVQIRSADECAAQVCNGNGWCKSLEGPTTCVCQDGATGAKCESKRK